VTECVYETSIPIKSSLRGEWNAALSAAPRATQQTTACHVVARQGAEDGQVRAADKVA